MSNISWMHISVQEATVGEIIRLCLEPKKFPPQFSPVLCSAVKGDKWTLVAHSLCDCKKGGISLCKNRWLIWCPAQPAAASTEKCKCLISLSLIVMLVSWKSQDPTIVCKGLCLDNEIPSWEVIVRELELCGESDGSGKVMPLFYLQLLGNHHSEMKRLKGGFLKALQLDCVLIEFNGRYL